VRTGARLGSGLRYKEDSSAVCRLRTGRRLNQPVLRLRSSVGVLLKFIILLIMTVQSLPALAGFPDAVDGQPLPSLAPMLESVTPAVVNISTRAASPQIDPRIEEFFGIQPSQRSPQAPLSLGSGVIIDAARGLVVTNDHVIANASEIQVTLADGRELVAQLIGTDPRADVALIQIKPERLSALKWADSEQLRVGDFCVAIGNPFGLGQTVTLGIVSALDRSGLGIEELEDFIQTDASINPGNSGGALVNLRGELIGINTAIVGPAGGNVGIGFAIPSNMVQDIVEQLLEFGEVRRGVLGIAAQALTPQLARRLNIERDYGVVIARVEPDSPAESSGLKIGDVIVEVDGKPVKTVESVVNRLGLVRVGREINLRVWRNNRELDIKTTVALIGEIHPLLSGVTLEDALSSRGRRIVLIASLRSGSRLDRLGLQRGDVVLSVNKIDVASVDQLKRVISPDDKQLLLLVQRGREKRYIDLQ